MAELALADLQRWMQGAILGRAAPNGLDAIIVGEAPGGGGLTAAQRLALYARGYRARLMECLSAEFPCLRALAGEQVFELFAAGYIADRPPTDPSLYGLGAGFADYLEATRPAGDDGPGALSAIPADLARLDRARAEVQRAVGVERQAGPLVAADLMLTPGARLRRPDSVRLLTLGFDPGPVLAAVDQGGPIDPPPSCSTPVAVARSRWRVAVHVLPSWRHAWLEALGSVGGGEEGADVHAAAARAAQATGRETGAVIADLTLWLPLAAAQGLVAAS
ncbi:MAG: putative DNA-binding domain-containing protein [Caulobacter sp.]|nr:putative DNA-binding domain-containing protein [Caulobacter sp.]